MIVGLIFFQSWVCGSATCAKLESNRHKTLHKPIYNYSFVRLTSDRILWIAFTVLEASSLKRHRWITCAKESMLFAKNLCFLNLRVIAMLCGSKRTMCT